MDSFGLSFDVPAIITKYRVHLFVFFLIFFIGLTLAHPAVLLNDEFITTNQIRQLHAGHQFVINEGRYGLAENGSMSGYFYYRSNILGYSLFLPLISLPAFWIVDLTGQQISYFVLVTWTVTALILLLFINHFFKKYSFFGPWQWTLVMAGIIFLLFFINLHYYSKFTIDNIESYPEILAVVMTNIVLLALSGIFIYEICRTMFDDPAFSFLGTMVCFFSSSYFLWSTFCKDHILTLACFIAIALFLVRFIKTNEYWYLPMAFMGCGLLAWIRPEVGLWMAILTVGVCGYTILRVWSKERREYTMFGLVCSPIFIFLGALPFFLNNYVVTGNVFLPVQSLYLSEGNATSALNTSQSLIRLGGVNSFHSLVTRFFPAVPTSPIETLSDFVGIFFYPATGNVAIFTLIPVFFVMIVLGTILVLFKKINFSTEEKRYITLLIFISIATFFAYASQIHLLNTDRGISPDIRYLSPMYVPFTLIGLIILRKINILYENPFNTIKELCKIVIIGTPISIIFLSYAYTLNQDFLKGVIPLGKFFNIYVMTLIILTLFSLIFSLCRNSRKEISMFLILLLYAIPFFWQVNATFLYSTFSGFAGHIFWIPIVRIFWSTIVQIIFF